MQQIFFIDYKKNYVSNFCIIILNILWLKNKYKYIINESKLFFIIKNSNLKKKKDQFTKYKYLKILHS